MVTLLTLPSVPVTDTTVSTTLLRIIEDDGNWGSTAEAMTFRYGLVDSSFALCTGLLV